SCQGSAIALGGPNHQLGIVIQGGSEGESVECVGARWIICLRYTNALRESAAKADIADDPAVRQPVVIHNWIACAGRAVAAQRAEERGEISRTGEQRTKLVVHGQPHIYSLHDVAGSDSEIDVRRRGAQRPCAVEVNAFSRGNEGANVLLLHWIGFCGSQGAMRAERERLGFWGFQVATAEHVDGQV